MVLIHVKTVVQLLPQNELVILYKTPCTDVRGFLLQATSSEAMIKQMKYINIKRLLLPVLMYAFTVNAGLYKGLDEEGNVVYSDTPFNNAKIITPPAITVVDVPKVIPKQEVTAEQKTEETSYTSFSISAPKNGQTIWNVADLTVALKLKPSLDIAHGHTTWLIMDGKPMVKKSQSMMLQIGRADRGRHTLNAQIKNKKGKIIKQTKSITVHIKNTVVQRKAR